VIQRLSIEVTDRCDRACAFCYARSRPDGARAWDPGELLAFVLDCAAHGTEAVSFGGGEPLQWPPLVDVLRATRGRLFRSITTNGLLLDGLLAPLARAALEKVHVSVHDPGNAAEVARVVRQVGALEASGIRGGVNLLVRRSGLAAARQAAGVLQRAGIGNDRIIFLPMRYEDTPAPAELATVARGPFQSATCLAGCAPSPRFASLAVDRTVARCSYTRRRAPLRAPTHAALVEALDGLELAYCGNDHRPPSTPQPP
jgi:hypothetical protein